VTCGVEKTGGLVVCGTLVTGGEVTPLLGECDPEELAGFGFGFGGAGFGFRSGSAALGLTAVI
jgi:hypothetical protein